MKFLLSLSLLLVLFVGLPSGAQQIQAPLTFGEKLRRISLTLRGLEPSPADLRWIESLPNSKAANAFLESSAKSYAKSEQFTAKVIERFSEVSRWNQTPFAPEWIWNSSLPDSSSVSDSSKDMISTTHNLLRSVIQQNRPWDQLLLAKTFLLPKGNSAVSALSEQDSRALEDYMKQKPSSFDSRLSSEIPRVDEPVIVAPKDHRFSGILTLSTFVNATPVNSDKVSFYKRAAAVLRIFHCEDLRPANLPSDTKSVGDELSLDEGDVSREGAASVKVSEKKNLPRTGLVAAPPGHASNTQCRVCHDKLDPISNLFKPLPRADDFYSSRDQVKKIVDPLVSTLLFADGSRVPVKGITGLAQALSQSPEFSRCQSQRLAQWFSPGKLFFSQAEKALLAQKFEQLGRRPQDFAVWAALKSLNSDSSSEQKSSNQSVAPETDYFPQASSFIQMTNKCNVCHRGNKSIPDFSGFIARSPEGLDWASKIELQTDLLGTGANAKMPPANSGKLSVTERDVLKQWVAFQRMAPGTDMGSVKTSRASFAKTWSCYPSPQDFSRRLWEVFGHLQRKTIPAYRSYTDQVSVLCELKERRGSDIAVLLGRYAMDTGEPLYSAPHAGFIGWYGPCIQDLTSADVFSSLVSEDPKVYEPQRYLPQGMIGLMEAHVPTAVELRLEETRSRSCSSCTAFQELEQKMPKQSRSRRLFLYRSWGSFSSGQQVEIIWHIASRIFPMGALEENRFRALVERIVGTSNVTLQKHTLGDALTRIQQMFLMSRAFLYVDPLCERGS